MFIDFLLSKFIIITTAKLLKTLFIHQFFNFLNEPSRRFKPLLQLVHLDIIGTIIIAFFAH